MSTVRPSLNWRTRIEIHCHHPRHTRRLFHNISTARKWTRDTAGGRAKGEKGIDEDKSTQENAACLAPLTLRQAERVDRHDEREVPRQICLELVRACPKIPHDLFHCVNISPQKIFREFSHKKNDPHKSIRSAQESNGYEMYFQPTTKT